MRSQRLLSRLMPISVSSRTSAQRSLRGVLVPLSALTLSVSLLSGGCDTTSDGDGQTSAMAPPNTERTMILTSMRHQVLIPLTLSFSEASQALRDAVGRRDLDASRDAWRVAMSVWHHLEMIQVGPAGVSGSRLGGADLRDHIYSFPISSACRVEQEWLAGESDGATWADQAPYQVKGLDALEHLLFKEGTDPVCPAQAQIVRDNLWSAFVMDAGAYEEARWAYASAISEDVERRAQELLDHWRGDFGDTFERAEAPFGAERDAVDQLFAAIFYLDLSVKDRKIGGPVGLHMTCLEETCPELIEHQASGFGREALIANLEGFLAVMRGSLDHESAETETETETNAETETETETETNTESSAEAESSSETTSDSSPFGLSALLAQEGAAEAGERLERLAQEAIAQLKGSELSLTELLERDPEMLREVYSTTREMSDLLRTQVVTTLNLSVPQEGAGDND